MLIQFPKKLFGSDSEYDPLLVNGNTADCFYCHCLSTKMMEFKEKLKERKAAEEAEKTKLENSESTNENKASELPTNSGEVTEEATSNGEQKQEATDRNAEGQTDASEKPDHSKMNGQIMSHLHNGDCASKMECEEEEHQSNITNGVPTESQSKSSNIMTSVSEAQSEPAVVNGKECVVNEGSGHLEKQAETE